MNPAEPNNYRAVHAKKYPFPHDSEGDDGPEEPLTDIQLGKATVDETAAIGTVVGVLSPIGGTRDYTFTLVSNPGGRFSIDGAFLKTGTALTSGTYPITIQADNGDGSTIERTFAIIAYATPDIQLANATVGDTSPVGSSVGALSTSGGTGHYTLSLLNNPGGLFFIAGSLLKTAAVMAVGVYAITIRANNGAGSVVDRSFLITVVSTANIQLDNTSIEDTAAAGSTIGSLSTTGGTGTYTFSLVNNLGGLFSIAGVLLKTTSTLAAGSYPITVRADNSDGSIVDRPFTITVVSPAVPTSNTSLYISQGIF